MDIFPDGVDVSALTPFQTRVFRRLCEVPAGEVTTYGALARAVGCGSAQAVGQALRHNPYAPTIPCHRVVRGDLLVGGYAGDSGPPGTGRKRRLLLSEGVAFEGERIASVSFLHDFLTFGSDAGVLPPH